MKPSRHIFKKQLFPIILFLLFLTFSLFFSACSCGVTVDGENDSSDSSTTIVDDLQSLQNPTPIDSLKNKMFVWLDTSLSSLLSLNSSGKLTNWVDRNSYTILQTNAITNGNIVTLSYGLTSPISVTPKSDVSANESLGLVVSNTGQGNNNYVQVDYEGSDRVGFKIDTSSLGDSHRVESFYLVTELEIGNNSWHVPLGYDNLGHQKRFLTKKHNERIYLVESRNESKAGLTLNEEATARERDFAVPNTIHLLSATNLGISKANLNGVLGTFPTTSQGGTQNIRELIIFTNELTALDHSNMVQYLWKKWNIPRQTQLITNLRSYYSHKDSDVIENVIDNDQETTFFLNHSPQNAVNGRLLFEFKLIERRSVLEPSVLASLGVSTGYTSLVLRTGNKNAGDTLKASVKVELLRKVDVLAGNNSWYTLTNVAVDNNNGAKSLIFKLLSASNDFIGYRLVATGNSSANSWLQIDDFFPSRLSSSNPWVTSLANTLPGGKIYNTNTPLFTNVFTNMVIFDQNIYGLEASDFQVSNGIIQSLTLNSHNNYTLVIKPFSFQSNSVQQYQFLKITLPESVVTNASGGVNHGYVKSIAFTIFHPFARPEFDVGSYSTPTFGDIDRDGDMDMVSGEQNGSFWFHSNRGSGIYTVYGSNHTANPFSGNSFDVGRYSKPILRDIDGDGDMDMVSGDSYGGLWFYSNRG